MIPGSSNPLLLAGAAEAGGYTISRSLRFNSADSAYLSKNFASAGNRKTWTWSGWVKRGKLGITNQSIFSAGTGASDTTFLRVRFGGGGTDDGLIIGGYDTNWRISNAVFRDASAWYHLVIAFDSTQAATANQIKAWVNGVELSWSSSSALTQNADYSVNSTAAHYIGNSYYGSYLDGYLADVHFIDGQALDPTSFGEFDATTGVWNPIAYTGSYPGNSFHLDFADNSSAAALGYDAAGSNDWTVNNIQGPTVNYGSAPLTTTSSASGLPLANMFDGSTSTKWEIITSGAHNLTATFSSAIPGGTLVEIYADKNNPGGASTVITVNGTNITSALTGGLGWYNISTAASGGISSITLYRQDGVMNPSIYALRVDGTIVVDVPLSSNDSLRDSPTNGDTANDTGLGGQLQGNYATLNPLNVSTRTATLSNGNLEFSRSSADHARRQATIGVATGKWYFEAVLTAIGGTYPDVGVMIGTASEMNNPVGGETGSFGYYTNGGVNGGGAGRTYSTYTTNDVIGIAIDCDNNRVTFYKNGANAVTSGTTYESLTSGATYFPAVSGLSGTAWTLNFGQRAFAYTAPSGFKALCTANLPTPTIEDPSTVMDIALWTGQGNINDRTITTSFNPDLVWIKSRSDGTYNHALFDANRGYGTNNVLSSNTTGAEGATDQGYIKSSTDSSITLGVSGGGNAYYNGGSFTYAAWTWDAGSSTVSNTDGSITSSVRANASAGFSIVTYTTPSSLPGTIGHGLGAEPYMIITKSRGAAGGWGVYHKNIGNTNLLLLNGTNAAFSGPNQWNSTTPTSTVFSIGTDYATSATYVAYCFAPVAGYSTPISWTGNGSNDGPFIYCGFRPKLILWHGGNYETHWNMYDSVRDTYNVSKKFLGANLSIGEDETVSQIDIVSNGFKIRSSAAQGNQSGQTYIGFAWAESPFAYSRAR